jgi:hypothetical protein
MQKVFLPSSLRIGPFDVTVNREGVPLPEDLLGLFLGKTSDIVVDMGQEPIQLVDTYLHEILHAIWRFSNLGDSTDEESAVACIATGLIGMMRDNPEFLDPIWEAIAIRRRERLAHDLRCEGQFS